VSVRGIPVPQASVRGFPAARQSGAADVCARHSSGADVPVLLAEALPHRTTAAARGPLHRPAAAHDEIQGTAANLLSSSDLDQVSPPLTFWELGSLLPSPACQDI
jgi:hypothetical protein